MEQGLCLSSKFECKSEDSHSLISAITFRSYDDSIDKIGFLLLVHDYFKEVHLSSHNQLINLDIGCFNYIESKIAEWSYRNCFVHLAMDGLKYIGFMVYESEKDVFGYMRAMYFDPIYKHKNLAVSFTKVLIKRGIKKVIAMSYSHNLEFKESKRKKLISEKDGLKFWDIDLIYRS
jgi:hypothetical protein